MNERIQEIITSYQNGQKEQMVDQIKEYGEIVFFEDLRFWIDDIVDFPSEKYKLFSNITLAYLRLKEI